MATLTRMYQRRGTATQWANVANTVILQPGEVGFETDTGKFKIGNGTDVWSALSYYLKDTQNAAIYVKLNPESPTYSQSITGNNVFKPQNAAQIPIVVSGISGQSAVLQRWRDVNDNTLASIDQTGKLTTANGALFNAQVNVNNNSIINVPAPVGDGDAVNKAYVDQAIAGLAWKEAVHLVAHGAGSNVALTGATNTLNIDTYGALNSTDNGYRLLLTSQTAPAENGIYVYNDNGTTYTLTRALDADTPAELVGASVYVQEGTRYGQTSWVQSNHYVDSFDDQTWAEFSGAALIEAGNGLVKDGNTIDVVGTADRITINADSVDIASTYVGQSSINTLGTVTTGTWSADTIAANKGGTGQTSYTVGDILYADSTSTLAKRSSGTSGYPLVAGGSGVAPSYQQLTTIGLADSTSTTTGVTYTKLQYMSSEFRILGRKSSGPGVVEELDPSDLITMINVSYTQISFDRLPATDSGVGNNGSATTVARSDHTHTINDLSDVVISGTPQTRQVIKFDGTNWINEVPSGGIVASATPPSQPASGDGWFDSTDGSLYIYYDDGVDNDGAGPGTSAQWVQVKANSALEASLLTRVSALEAQQTNAAYNIVAAKTTSYTVGNGDQNDLIQMNSGSALNLLIPTDATYNFPIGTKIEILQVGAGRVTIAAVTPGTTTVNGTPGLKLRAQWSHAAIIKRAANTWVAIGDLAA